MGVVRRRTTATGPAGGPRRTMGVVRRRMTAVGTAGGPRRTMGVVRRRMTHGAGPAERPRTPGGEAQHTATDAICAGVRAVSRSVRRRTR